MTPDDAAARAAKGIISAVVHHEPGGAEFDEFIGVWTSTLDRVQLVDALALVAGALAVALSGPRRRDGGPVEGASAILRAAKDGAASGEVVDELTEQLGRDDLVSVLKLMVPVVAELYGVMRASSARPSLTRTLFDDITASLGDINIDDEHPGNAG